MTPPPLSEAARRALQSAEGWLLLGGEQAHFRAWEELRELSDLDFAHPSVVEVAQAIRAVAAAQMVIALAEP